MHGEGWETDGWRAGNFCDAGQNSAGRRVSSGACSTQHSPISKSRVRQVVIKGLVDNLLRSPRSISQATMLVHTSPDKSPQNAQKLAKMRGAALSVFRPGCKK